MNAYEKSKYKILYKLENPHVKLQPTKFWLAIKLLFKKHYFNHYSH